MEGIARLDYESKVINVLECELPKEQTRADAIFMLPGCHVSANHVHENPATILGLDRRSLILNISSLYSVV